MKTVAIVTLAASCWLYGGYAIILRMMGLRTRIADYIPYIVIFVLASGSFGEQDFSSKIGEGFSDKQQITDDNSDQCVC